MGRRLALVIGVNQYQDAAFRPLQYAETDAKALAQWLVNERGGRWQPADVQLVMGAHATRELVESLITQTCVNVAGPGDLVLIYFAGHAFLDEKTGDGYLALANTHYRQTTSGLHLLSLARQAMGQSRAANILMILDCFQTGQLWNMRRQSPYDSRPLPGPTLLNALQQNSGRLVLCSCRGNETAPETGEKNLGVLAYKMIVGLCGPASDPDTGQITLQRLHAFLFNALGQQQRPQLFGQEQGHVVLVGHTASLPVISSPSPPKQSTQSAASFSAATAAPVASPFNAHSPQYTTTGSLLSQTGQQRPAAIASLPRQMSPSTSPVEKQCEALLQQARTLLQMQNPAQALQLIDQTLQIAPNYLNALILKGQLLGTVERFQEAIAVVEQAMRIDTHNALLWSMYAALLTNVGRYQEALSAIERSLELDSSNPETYAIKTSIMGNIAAVEHLSGKQAALAPSRRGGLRSFSIALGIALLGLLIGLAGAALPIRMSNLPIALAILLESMGLALLCVNAARGSYLYGFTRLLLTTIFSLLSIGALAALYRFKYASILLAIKANPPLLLPYLFLAAWLIVAAALPFLLSIMGLIAGLIRGVRRKR